MIYILEDESVSATGAITQAPSPIPTTSTPPTAVPSSHPSQIPTITDSNKLEIKLSNLALRFILIKIRNVLCIKTQKETSREAFR